MRWSDERFVWERDASYPNPSWLDESGKAIHPLPSDWAPLYSSFATDGRFPLYTCSQCRRRLPPGNFARSELAKLRQVSGNDSVSGADAGSGRCGACTAHACD